MSKKIKVGILFGGRSAEHEVSLLSARNVVEAINKEKYEPVLIGITEKNDWVRLDSKNYLRNPDDPKSVKLHLRSGKPFAINVKKSRSTFSPLTDLDVVFPVLHGPYGEDGTVQGLLKFFGIPFVGASVLGSSVGMDKDVMKRLLRDGGVPVAEFFAVNIEDRKKIEWKKIVKSLGLPFFVKPANLGSSVGVSKVSKLSELNSALDLAFSYDRKILLEMFIDGREIECAVLGGEDPKASIAGEVIPQDSFYSYRAKYLDEGGAKLEIPANLERKTLKRVQDLSLMAFRILCCEGMARVDFFVTKENKVYVNEINTIPGFTKISMYPKLWEASGISYADLIDKLITIGLQRFAKEKMLKVRR